MSWDEWVIHLFVAILVLESYEGRGVVVEHTLEGSMRSNFSHARAPSRPSNFSGRLSKRPDPRAPGQY